MRIVNLLLYDMRIFSHTETSKNYTHKYKTLVYNYQLNRQINVSKKKSPTFFTIVKFYFKQFLYAKSQLKIYLKT